jgi:hypothetical protein
MEKQARAAFSAPTSLAHRYDRAFLYLLQAALRQQAALLRRARYPSPARRTLVGCGLTPRRVGAASLGPTTDRMVNTFTKVTLAGGFFVLFQLWDRWRGSHSWAKYQEERDTPLRRPLALPGYWVQREAAVGKSERLLNVNNFSIENLNVSRGRGGVLYRELGQERRPRTSG